jgi:predicted site-specific integrase-resolvase
MKAAEVLNLLRISRPTLTNYVKQGYLKVATLPNGRYDYNDKSVYRFMNKDIPRKNVIYARVSTRKQKKDLENQIQLLKHLCFQNGIIINGIYEDIASGMNLDRKNLLPLIKEIINYKINSVIISHKDRLSRIGFKLFQHLFREFGTELVVINELESGSTEQEIFQEIISLLHCYAMSMYSRRRKDFVKKKKREFQDEISVQI